MIVLDTNVLSEQASVKPSLIVEAWMAKQDRDDLFTTTITEAEMFGGVALMPAGKRRDEVAAVIESLFSQTFSGRILPFDSVAARAFPDVLLSKGRKKTPLIEADLQIAAIARAHGAAVATRNVAHFQGCGIAVINPWTG